MEVKLKISQIYPAIEGEGLRIGTPQIFIRTQGCKLRGTLCSWCDTPKSLSYTEGGTEVSVEKIVEIIEGYKYNIKNISLSGGNPLEQPDIFDLVKLLNKKKYTVNIEAAGLEFNKKVFNIVDFISCDIKPPSSSVEWDREIITKIAAKYDFKTQFKIVIASQKDIDFAKMIVNDFCYNKLYDFNLILTPCWTEKQKQPNMKIITKLHREIFENKLPVRLIAQQHKMIFGAMDLNS